MVLASALHSFCSTQDVGQATPRTPHSLAHSLNVAELSLAKHGLHSLSQRAAVFGSPVAVLGSTEVVPAHDYHRTQLPHVHVEKTSRGCTHPPHAQPPPPPPPQFELGTLPEDRSGTADLMLFHELGSASHARPGAILPSSEQLASLLPEGSAELLLLKKARLSC